MPKDSQGTSIWTYFLQSEKVITWHTGSGDGQHWSFLLLVQNDDVIAEQFERDKNVLKACIGLPLERQGQ